MRESSSKKIINESDKRQILTRSLSLLILILFTTTLFAQTGRTVSGTVTDALGEELIGVNVMVKGTAIGTITDIDGNFSLQVPDNNATLVFSFIGFRSQEVAVGNRNTVSITLLEDLQSLDEVVVVGYGVQKKETVTGAVSTIKGEDLVKSPVANISNAIAGKLSGVVTYQRSGEPGNDGSTIRIRGVNTLGNNDPLFVIDGVTSRKEAFERIDPNEIESMSVLKDASSAIYGARAANGVILITTKRGRVASKPQLSYSFNQGWGKPTQLPKMSNAAEYAELRNELIVNDAAVNPKTGETPNVGAPWKTAEEIQKYRDGSDPWRYPDTDWYAATFKNWSPQHIHNATIEGGTDKITYFTTFGYKYQDGLYHNSANNYEQFNLRMNMDAEINQYIKVGVNMMGRQENRNYPTQSAGDLLWFTARGRPTDPAYWPNGLPGPAQEYGRNPVVVTTNETGYDKQKTYIINTNARVEITQPWIEGLKFTGTLSYDKRLFQRKYFFQPWNLYTWDYQSYEADGVTPKLDKSLSYVDTPDPKLRMHSEDETAMVLGGLITYDNKFGDHGINFLFGTEKDKSDNSYFQAYRRYYLSNAVQLFDAGGDVEKSNSSSVNGTGEAWKNNWDRARANFFGRIAYNYQEKYLAEFVWRYDASYMFPRDNRYGFFPGVLLGYRISEENFWKNNLPFIEYFKIRASWGQLGNDQVYWDDTLQEFQFLETYKYAYGYIIDNQDVQALEITRFPNHNITWEVANNMNIGIEMRTLDNRLYLEADYFYNKRSKILWRRNASIPQTAGLTLPAENIGKVNNTGFDFKVEWNDRIGKDFRYSISGTGGYAKNTIKYWDESPGAPEWQQSTGYPMNTRLYYQYDGVFKDWDEINDPNRPNYDGITSDANLQPGDMKFKDVNGDGKITPDDRVRSDKNNIPRWTYGINGYFQYKDFDLSILFQGAAYSWTKIYFDSGEIGNYAKKVYDNHWSEANPSSVHPRVHARQLYYWDTNNENQENTYWMVNTNYIRLKNLELGYTVPRHIVEKTKFFSYARVYMSGVNLLTFSPSKDIDPESDSAGGTKYPQSKIINVGFSVTF